MGFLDNVGRRYLEHAGPYPGPDSSQKGMSIPAREDRMSREELFMSIAELVARRGTCLRAKVGAVAIMSGRVVSTGYVGAVAGEAHCTSIGCLVIDGHCVRTVHAEANVIAWAARTSVGLRGATLYTTVSPCLACAKLLINAGIEAVIYRDDYSDSMGVDLLKGMKVLVRKYGS